MATDRRYNHGTELYYVLLQREASGTHQIEGEIWAPNSELALFYAKEQFARRGRCHDIWIVPASAVIKASADWSTAYRRDAQKRWRHAGFFSAGREETPDLVRQLIRDEEGAEHDG